MITSEDRAWLAATHPGLIPSDVGVSGTVQFSATYNEERNLFLILEQESVDDVGGIRLACRYRIRIEECKPGGYTMLPAVYVEDVDAVADRHFRRNKSACLCSPLEEKDFVTPDFEFRKFLEQLVIPFLYGQSFYSSFHRWPWREYAHNATGLLEAFADQNVTDVADMKRFLEMLAADRDTWPLIHASLQRGRIKGHTPCFCPRRDHFRRCHPKALAGLRRLQQLIGQQQEGRP